jgi:hypothetical protein
VQVESAAQVEVKGTQVSVKGTAQLDLSASGQATLKGAITMIG